MAYFPLYINIEGQLCLVVGGGRVAEGKVGQLLEFGANVTVIAPTATQQLALWQEEGRIALHLRGYRPDDLTGALLAVAATDDVFLQRQVAAQCRERNILVNVVDAGELCTFFFPAIVKREDVVAAVSTGGKSPALAAKLRRDLEDVVTESYGRAAAIMGAHREYVLTHVAGEEKRKQVFAQMLELVLAEGKLSGDRVRKLCGCKIAVDETDYKV